MNVKNLFLHGTLSQVDYMTAPLGYGALPSYVCRFCRAIYGVDFSLQYFELVSWRVAGITLFVWHTRYRRVVLLRYMDYMIITGDNACGILYVKHYL